MVVEIRTIHHLYKTTKNFSGQGLYWHVHFSHVARKYPLQPGEHTVASPEHETFLRDSVVWVVWLSVVSLVTGSPQKDALNDEEDNFFPTKKITCKWEVGASRMNKGVSAHYSIASERSYVRGTGLWGCLSSEHKITSTHSSPPPMNSLKILICALICWTLRRAGSHMDWVTKLYTEWVTSVHFEHVCCPSAYIGTSM